MRCVICDSTSEWENVDQFRIKQIGMSICKKCGMVSYPEYWEKFNEDDPAYTGKTADERMQLYYTKSYRRPPSAHNLFSGQKKLHYHAAFLEEFIGDWKKKENFEVCDIGAAYGLFLQWFKSSVPNATLSGTEWTTAFKRNAYHEFGINLTDEVDKSKKYDLICLYKVAEHLLDADKKLIEYKTILNEGGMIYISVPVWFDTFFNFGTGGMDLEYMYSIEHINVWSRKLFRQLLRKCGLEVVKENYTYYDDSYLCKPCDPVAVDDLEFDDYEETKVAMHKLKKAHDFHMDAMPEKGLEEWPNSPILWLEYYERNRRRFHEKGIVHIVSNVLDPAKKSCPHLAEVWGMAGDIYMRYDMYKEAIENLDTALKMRPGSPIYLAKVANCFRMLSQNTNNEKEKNDFRSRARDICRHIKSISFQNFDEMVSWIYTDNASLPTPHEEPDVNGK